MKLRDLKFYVDFNLPVSRENWNYVLLGRVFAMLTIIPFSRSCLQFLWCALHFPTATYSNRYIRELK